MRRRGKAYRSPPWAGPGRSTEQAIAELIDNAVDARGRGGVSVRVSLGFKAKSIAVEDDGPGMDPASLRDAMSIDWPARRGAAAREMPGLGMRGACAALGRQFTVTTSAAGSPEEHSMGYDEAERLSGPGRPQGAPGVARAAKARPWHGTRIRIGDLRVPLYPQQVGALLARYGARYAQHIRSEGARIYVNGRAAAPVEPELDGKRHAIDIRLDGGNRVTGWVGVMRGRSPSSRGFALHRRGRVMRVSDSFGLDGHPSLARLTGELHLDHVPVNRQETRFATGSAEYREAELAFEEDPTVRSLLLRVKESARETLDPLISYVTTGGVGRRFRASVGKDDARRLVARATPFEFDHDGSRVKFDFAFGSGEGLYAIRKEGAGHRIVVDRNSHVFSMVRNPSALLAMVWEEAKLALRHPDAYDKFVRERNGSWEKFAGAALGHGKPGKMPAGGPAGGPRSKYGYLSPNLDSVQDVLASGCSRRYQLTALCVLEPYLHYAQRNLYYTIMTERRHGGHVQALLAANARDDITFLHSPTREQLGFLPSIADNSVFVIIREYANIQASTVASHEKAILDLYGEKRRGLPIGQRDIEMLVNTLQEDGVISVEKLHRMARHRNLEPTFYTDRERVGA